MRQHLLKSETDGAEAGINTWQLKDLGFQASQRVLGAEDPLAGLTDISQNFPNYVHRLTKIRVQPKAKKALKALTHQLKPGDNHFSINGLSFDPEEVTVFDIQRVLQSEARTVAELRATSGATLSQDAIANLLELKPNQHRAGDVRVRMKEGEGEQGAVVWMNDIEKDGRYRSWDPSLKALLQGWPNQLRYVRKNLHTAVVVVDPSSRAGLSFVERANFFVQANAPIRVGVVFQAASGSATACAWPADSLGALTEWQTVTAEGADGCAKADDAERHAADSIGQTIAKYFYYLEDKFGWERAINFIKYLAEMQKV